MIRLCEWFGRKWSYTVDPTLHQDYLATFSTVSGQRVLQHWFDSVYCTVYGGHDPIESAYYNGRRSVIHELLKNLDYAEHPHKYHNPQTQEMP